IARRAGHLAVDGAAELAGGVDGAARARRLDHVAVAAGRGGGRRVFGFMDGHRCLLSLGHFVFCGPAYSAFVFAGRITLPHFSSSAAMNFVISAGDFSIGSTPRSASRALNFGSASAVPVAALSLAMMSAGVPFGAPMAYQPTAS